MYVVTDQSELDGLLKQACENGAVLTIFHGRNRRIECTISQLCLELSFGSSFKVFDCGQYCTSISEDEITMISSDIYMTMDSYQDTDFKVRLDLLAAQRMRKISR